MESIDNGGTSGANEGVAEQFGAIAVTAPLDSPVRQQPRRTLTGVFNDDVMELMGSDELPALSIIFQSALSGFNYDSVLRKLIPMAFGMLGRDYLTPDGLLPATKELDGVVGALTEEGFLSTLDPRRTQSDVKFSLCMALHRKGAIFKVHVGERADVISGDRQRYGRFLQSGFFFF